MARRTRKREKKEERYEFKPPPFDEKEFLKKELLETKVTLITVFYGIIIAVISLVCMLVTNGDWRVGFLIGLVAIALLKYLYNISGIDTKKFDWKKWPMNIGMFFFVWLTVWILISNPPVADFTKPTIENVKIKIPQEDNGVTKEVTKSIEVIEIDGHANITILAKITDNGRLKKEKLKLEVTRGDGRKYTHLLKEVSPNIYSSTFLVGEEDYIVEVSAVDTNNNEAFYKFTLRVL